MTVDKSTLKKFVDAGYKNKRDVSNIDGYVLDNDLSTRRNKVYYNPETKKVKHVIAGTDNLKDWANNLLIPLGLHHHSNRYKNSEETQKKANEKYGKENVDLITHSQSGNIAENLAKRNLVGGENTSLNPAIIGKHNENLKVVKSAFDPVSLLTKTNENDTVLKPTSYNPVTEHLTGILGDGLTHIQSILFDRPQWTMTKAKKWLKKHNYKTDVDKKPEHYRFRQIDPDEFSSYRTKHIGDNITLIIGLKKKGGSINNMNIPNENELLGRMAQLSHDIGVHHDVLGPKQNILDAYKMIGHGIVDDMHGKREKRGGSMASMFRSVGSMFAKNAVPAMKKVAVASASAAQDAAIEAARQQVMNKLKNYGKKDEEEEEEEPRNYKSPVGKKARAYVEQKISKNRKKIVPEPEYDDEDEDDDEEYEPPPPPRKSRKTTKQQPMNNIQYEQQQQNQIVPYNNISNQPSSYERSWSSKYGRGIHGKHDMHGDGAFDWITDLGKKAGSVVTRGFDTINNNTGHQFDDVSELLHARGTKAIGKKLAKMAVKRGVPLLTETMGTMATPFLGPGAGFAGGIAGDYLADQILKNTEIGGYGLHGRSVSYNGGGQEWNMDHTIFPSLIKKMTGNGRKMKGQGPWQGLESNVATNLGKLADKGTNKLVNMIGDGRRRGMKGQGPWGGLEENVATNLGKLADKGTNKLVNMIGDGRRRGMKGCGPWGGLEENVATNLGKLADKGTNKLVNMIGDGVKRKGRFPKGSQEAKDHMARIRAMKKH